MVAIHSSLSCSGDKRNLFAIDPFFREAWEDVLQFWSSTDAIYKLHQIASIVYRPDAIVTRGVERAMRATSELGFTPVACNEFRFDRLSIRECWRYQLNAATFDRIEVMDLIMPTTISLYVVLHRRQNEYDV